jgi:nanoRNase/pAp phosphatase (c-di-AMP/oligoRNAs hydrolase)
MSDTEVNAPRATADVEPEVTSAQLQLETKERVARLSAMLDQHRSERHVVALQDYPDPDAISAALAYQLIAERFDIRADIMYEGAISHQENLALVRLLDIELIRYNDEVRLSDYHHSVFLDNQGTTTALTERLEAAGVKPLIIIDHHERQNIIDAPFTDIRPLSATATMLVEYLSAGLGRVEVGRPESQRLATALMHGLRSETDSLIRAKQEDFIAAAWLSKFVNDEMLRAVLRVNRTRAVMEVVLSALSRRTINNGYSFAGIGFIRLDDRDAIPQAADFLLTEENVHTAIVYGIVTGPREALMGSLRTAKLTLDVDHFLKDALGCDQRGRYYGGGRHGAGGFEIPIGFLSAADDEQTRQLKWQVYHRQVERMLLEKIGALDSERKAKAARERDGERPPAREQNGNGQE